jgi:hypothetical protein
MDCSKKLLLSLLGFFIFNQALASDSTYKAFTYYRIGLDFTKPFARLWNTDRFAIEMQADVNFKRNLNLVTEAGWGSSKVNNDRMEYTATNSFLRLGVDHPFFNAEFPGDKDNAFVGFRYALGLVQRSDASYVIQDPIWGTQGGVFPGKTFLAHWVEINGGFRMEVKPNIFAGWNIRLKAIVNTKKFQTLPPAHMAGYGRGDKNTAADFSFYLLYGFGNRN